MNIGPQKKDPIPPWVPEWARRNGARIGKPGYGQCGCGNPRGLRRGNGYLLCNGCAGSLPPEAFFRAGSNRHRVTGRIVEHPDAGEPYNISLSL